MSSKPRIYITRKVPMTGIRLLQEKPYQLTHRDTDEPITNEELLAGVKGVDVLFCLLTDTINKAVLDAGPNLKAVVTMSVGFDHIDVEECKRRKIQVGNTPDVSTDAVAEMTVALLLATSRRLLEGIRAVKNGEWGTWRPLWLCGQGLQNSTVGVVGLGRIGMGVAERLKPHKVAKFLYSGLEQPLSSTLPADWVSFEELLDKSDFVIACCALTPQTKEMFNAKAFKRMKKNAVFINTSRGGVVQQDDLYQALVSQEIAAAGLDVTVPEPLPTDHPMLKLDNCIILPHIGSATVAAREAMSDMAGKNVIAVLEGKRMPYHIPDQ